MSSSLRKSDRSVRLRGLQNDADRELLEPIVKAIGKLKAADSVLLSIAQQGESKVATVTYGSADAKHKAKRCQPGQIWEWCDDRFEGLTVLHTPTDLDSIDIDICAVHGLNGNAFDTWMANAKMWLRDILPHDEPFQNSRIMTFGYNSTLVDKRGINDRFEDFSKTLVDLLSIHRNSERERSRPLVFICHSMGGLVARSAMVRLINLPRSVRNLKASQCGFLFLATPHHGSPQANVESIFVAMGKYVGVKENFIKDLRIFPARYEDDIEAFQKFAETGESVPMFCFAEQLTTVVAGRQREIVPEGSAGFWLTQAVKLQGTDHHTICKFDFRSDMYIQVRDRLKTLRSKLLQSSITASAGQLVATTPISPPLTTLTPQPGPANLHFSGQPLLTAPSYPLPSTRKWYLGKGLPSASSMLGRNELLRNVLQKVETTKRIFLTGMGGIGKTEMLLQAALDLRNERSIFFIRARNMEELDNIFYEMAECIGHDTLVGRYEYHLLPDIWRNYGKTARIEAFKEWLGIEKNEEAIVFLDDMDGLAEYEGDPSALEALPRDAKTVLISTRDPSLSKWSNLATEEIRLAPMHRAEIKDLLWRELRKTSGLRPSQPELEEIANIVHGHPLSTICTASFIQQLSTSSDHPVRDFLNLINSQDWKNRREFLEHVPRYFGFSIMSSYRTSLSRLPKEQAEDTKTLLSAISFLTSSTSDLNASDFFRLDMCWIAESTKDFFQCRETSVFVASPYKRGSWLTALDNASVGLGPTVGSRMRIHPIWLECIRQECEHVGRLRWLRLILAIAYHHKNTPNSVEPFVNNCLEIARRFSINLTELENHDPEIPRDWLQGFLEKPEISNTSKIDENQF
ncbi:hypothetical protein F5884DRAFT_338992 [Xylogone sp. PMI_703]|nr:hypothetical protein F5884DRAFT_338992 [Xylogone sp. PMI_703]